MPYDQLSDRIGPLTREPARDIGIVLVESPWKAARRPYHRQKLFTVLANQRHFALEQAERGVAVRYVVHNGPYSEALKPVLAEVGELRVMRPAERELRQDVSVLCLANNSGLVEIPHEGWLSTPEDFSTSEGAPPFRMDRFYRHMRKKTGLLMQGGKPLGGKLSHDAENRKPWRGDPAVPKRPHFAPDEISLEVAALIEKHFSTHPGTLQPDALPVTRADIDRYWAWVQRECLPLFGPYEDAMSTKEPHLFHTLLSPLINLHRLLPREVVEAAARLPLPLASQEGFIRQVLGWREYMRHIHEVTDGFRVRPDGTPLQERTGVPLPRAFWDASSGLHCLDSVVKTVWRDGFSHHITRLMVLSNIAQLIDASPRELSNWFWEAYTDAYDWVVEPNVLGMGTFAFGDLLTTKPYISGAAYIHRMSDYCGSCAFDPKTDCPLTPLYWAYLARHESTLAPLGRTMQPLMGLRGRSAEKKANDAVVFERVQGALMRGEKLTPSSLKVAKT